MRLRFTPSQEQTEEQKQAGVRDQNHELHVNEQKFHRERRRVERLSAKLKRIEALIKSHSDKGDDSVTIKALQHALHPTHTKRFRSVVKVIMMSKRLERMKMFALAESQKDKTSATRGSRSSLASTSKAGSKACSIQ